MTHTARWTALAFLLAAVGCDTSTNSMKDISVRTEGDPGIRFRVEGTYSWAIRPGALPEGVRDQPFAAHMMVREAIERELARKGFEYRGAGYRVDFLVYYRVVLEDTPGSGRAAQEPGAAKEETVSASEQRYERGTLMIDLLQPKTMKLLWRGIADAKIDTTPQVNQQERRRRIDTAVRMILARFPQG